MFTAWFLCTHLGSRKRRTVTLQHTCWPRLKPSLRTDSMIPQFLVSYILYTFTIVSDDLCIVCTLQFLIPHSNVGAIYRYYESRRRLVLDSKPDRTEKAEQNRMNTKLYNRQHRVRICLCIYVYAA